MHNGSGSNRSALIASFLRWWCDGNSVLCGQVSQAGDNFVRGALNSELAGRHLANHGWAAADGRSDLCLGKSGR